MKSLLIKNGFAFFFLLLSVNLNASHFSGLDLWYECLPGGCNYRLFQTVYMDCGGSQCYYYLPPSNGINFPSTLVSVKGVGCGLDTLLDDWTFIYFEDVTPVCPSTSTACYSSGASINGVVGVSYYTDFSLCNSGCNAVDVTLQSCCRNYSIQSGAAGQGIYNSTHIDLTLSACNSSPRIIQNPVSYLCSGQSSIIKGEAFDPDGDSLVYSLGACMADSVNSVTYNPGFSPTNPLGPNWSVSINSQTGDLSFTPSPTGSITSAVLCELITEFRNGIQIGQTRRDIMVYVINCNGILSLNNNLPTDTLTAVSGGIVEDYQTISVYAGQALSFDIIAEDIDLGQTLSYRQSPLFPAASIIPTTTGNQLTLHFNWTPPLTSVGANYLWTDFFDDDCLINGHTTRLVNIIVKELGLSATVTNTTCGNPQGAIDLSVISPDGNPPYHYSWSSGDTTEDLSGLSQGNYFVTVTDSVGNQWSCNYFVNLINPITSSPTIGNLICSNSTAIIAINASGGTPPLQYLWNTGDTTPVITNVPPGGYSVDVSDTLGCTHHKVIIANQPPFCYSRVSGTMFDDLNGNCIKDTLEAPLPWQPIYNYTWGNYILTDINGHYEFMFTNPSTYTFGYLYNNPYYINVCSGTNSYTVTFPQNGIDTAGFDFPISVDTVIDLRVFLLEGNYVPGFSNRIGRIFYKNAGGLASPATITYQHSPLLHSVTFSVPPTSYDSTTQTAIWNFPLLSFLPYYHKIVIYGDVAVNALLGSVTTSEVNITPLLNDIIPANNYDFVPKTVVGSYDPNFKEVSPQGVSNEGYIPYNTPALDYTIHFQNTGTWIAEYVVIKDKLDSNLDLTTLEYIGASHNCTIAIDANDTLIITFPNIHLPDSGSDMAGSQGFVSFSIKPKAGLTPETTISNTVGIYFDFNAPVITNTVNSTFHYSATVDLSTPICEGNSVTATVQNGVPPYLWNGTVYDTTGVYTFIADTTGVQSLTLSDAFEPVNVSYNVLSAPVNASFTHIPVGNTTVFMPQDNTYSTYLWDFGNGTTSNALSPSVIYPQSGNYVVTLTVSNDCGTLTNTQTVSITTDVAHLTFASSVKIYPNPFSRSTLLTFDNSEKAQYTLSIWDISGKLVKNVSFSTSEYLIQADNLAAGIYTWELKGKRTARGKLAVE